MARRGKARSICRPYDSGSGNEEGTKFILFVDGQHPQIHEVWNLREDGVTRKVHPTARVHVGAGFVGEFATDYINPSWRRVSMFGINSINRSVKWLGVPDFLRTDGPPLRLSISWLPILVGETEGTAPIQTGVVNLWGVLTVLPSQRSSQSSSR